MKYGKTLYMVMAFVFGFFGLCGMIQFIYTAFFAQNTFLALSGIFLALESLILVFATLKARKAEIENTVEDGEE